MGVTYDKTRDRYRARRTVNGVTKHLGYYKTKEDAQFEYELDLKLDEQSDFKHLKTLNDSEQDYIKTPVSRPFKQWTPTFITRLNQLRKDLWESLKIAWEDTKY